MTLMRLRVWLMLIGTSICANPLQAQERSAGFAGGLGGATVGDQRGAVYGVRTGVGIGKGLFVVGEAGRIQNVLPGDVQTELDVVERLIELQGIDVSIDASVPVFYGMGGVRWALRRGRVSPFLEAGAGFARLSLDVDAVVDGADISEDLLRDLEDEGIEATKFLFSTSGGISLAVQSAWTIDVGYRYARIFTDDPRTNVNVVFGALHYNF